VWLPLRIEWPASRLLRARAMKLLCLVLFFACSARAATSIEVDAKFADVPAGTEIPATAEKLDKLKGIEVLSSPQVITVPGRSATIEITQEAMVPGAQAVPLGLTLTVTPTLGEKTIHFTGKATDRASHGKRSGTNVNTVEFATRELYFEGSVVSGGTAILHSAPLAAKGEKNVSKTRELVVFLKFTRRVTEEAPVKKATPAATKKPAPPVKKATTTIKPSATKKPSTKR
jgi:hypothetical protein